jgi:hypothetical protein
MPLKDLILPRMALVFGSPNEAARTAIEAIALPPAAKAGLWLLHDFFEESHAISQDLHTPEGSYWHAILHRREPDPSNAKYWFRQVGRHPVMQQVQTEAPALGYAYTTASKFVDDCAQVTSADDVLLDVQFLEWRLLFDYCKNPGITAD